MKNLLLAIVLGISAASCCSNSDCEQQGVVVFLTFQEMNADSTTTVLTGRNVSIKDASGSIAVTNEVFNPSMEQVGFVFFAPDQAVFDIDFDGIAQYELFVTTEISASDGCCDSYSMQSFTVNGETTTCTEVLCQEGGNITLSY